MQIKVFRAATMKEAMAQVKEALGDDAVILHTKTIKEGGVLGYGSKNVIEVTAAIDEESKVAPGAPDNKPHISKDFSPTFPLNAPSDMPTVQPPKTVLSMYKMSGTKEGVMQAENAVQEKKEDTNTINNAFIPMQKEDILHKSRIIKAGDFENSQEGLEKPNEKPNSEAEGTMDLKTPESEASLSQHNEDAEKIERLETELAEIKTLLANFMRKESSDTTLSLQEAMENHEVQKNILDAMAATSGAGETMAEATSPEAKATLITFLEKKVKFASGIDISENRRGSKIVALIGPTGVGKTTTLAKIAAGFVLNKQAKAALITADTYRISAVEQLKTYSDIIGLPLDIVYNQDELRKAIRKHEDKDLILIDTAGRSQYNEYQLEELKTLLKANSRIEKHLVLSATTKERDAKDIIERFSFCNPKRVIFTKVDETSSLGIILNLLYEKDMALSYLADGQSVPDDIKAAGAETLAGLFLRE